MTIRQALPLPECAMCAAPTRREAWERNGELCSPCATGIADTVRMLPVRGDVVDLGSERDRRRRLASADVALTDETVYVERYTPPVPGQLELDEP